ncbi:MAG: type I-D CRISPR-associated helicase Cas3' [Deltaproteobacteria bacterium]|nr:type I-D CRISPR-associated helicase Cas3' [Deltaproteobacteria bacterium]
MPEPLRIRLEAEYQRRAAPETIPDAVRHVLPHPLQHQVDTAAALATHDMVINAFPTGTGKTKAALLWLLDHPHANTLLIAPVNELVRQHAHDAQQFVTAAGLSHIVESVDAAFLRTLPEELGKRPSERFYRILTNPAVLPQARATPGTAKPPLLLVTNPDLFYYAVFYLFNQLDRRNIAEQFIAKFHYIIIDEVHYYDAKQFANLLFFILLSKEFGYFSPDLPERRKICLLTATPDADVNRFIERLEHEGVSVKRLDPQPVSPDDPLATKSLTEVELELHPYNTRDAATELLPHVGRIAEWVTQGKDSAVLLNSLYGVNRVAREFERALGREQVGRLTGPLSREERREAPYKPMLLATPTVDIGFNFAGHPKTRQNLDFVGFEAQREDQFWQRLGRVGRVLGKEEQDTPSTALALIPDEALKNLRQQIGSQTSFSRAQLRSLLHEAAGERMQRPSFAQYVSSYALLEITQPLAEMEKLLGENAEIVERVFDRIKRVYAPSSKKQLWSLRGEIRRYQGFRRIQEDLRKPSIKSDPAVRRALREYALEEGGQAFSEEQIALKVDSILSASGARARLHAYVAREVAALSPVFSFRDANIGAEVLADDPHGLVSSLRETVPLDVFHLLRFYDWHLKEESTRSSSLQVVLLDLLQPPLKVGLTFHFDGSWEQFRKRYMKKPTALQGLNLSRQTQGAVVSTAPQLVAAVAQRYVPCLVLEQGDLKEWQWGSLSRDGVYFMDLEMMFQDSPEKKLRLFSGLDGYRVMGRYGWSIQRTTGEWWVV